MSNEPTAPRGIRNKNPGNIRHSPAFYWRGETGTDSGGFCTFDDPVYGIRAIIILFHNYQEYEHLRTLNQLIRRWAPPSENDSTDYVRFVAGRLGLQPDSQVDTATVARPLAHAIVSYENGSDPYDLDVYSRAIDLALNYR